MAERSTPKTGRPIMPASYGISAAADGVMSWSWAEDQLTKSRNYWISSTRPDGRPHAMPVWGIWLDGAVVFGTGRDSAKGRNLAARPDVVVHTESGDDVVIIEGVVEEIALGDADLSRRMSEAYNAKYGLPLEGEDPTAVLYAVRPRVALAWIEQDFPNTATRFVF